MRGKLAEEIENEKAQARDPSQLAGKAVEVA